MKKYVFNLQKVQRASVSLECCSDDTVQEVMKKIQDMSFEKEIEFSDPEYILTAISKDSGKVSKLLWLLG